MSYTKMTKEKKIRGLKICILGSTLLSYACVSTYKVFETDIYTFAGYTVSFTQISLNFFETWKYDFF